MLQRSYHVLFLFFRARYSQILCLLVYSSHILRRNQWNRVELNSEKSMYNRGIYPYRFYWLKVLLCILIRYRNWVSHSIQKWVFHQEFMCMWGISMTRSLRTNIASSLHHILLTGYQPSTRCINYLLQMVPPSITIHFFAHFKYTCPSTASSQRWGTRIWFIERT